MPQPPRYLADVNVLFALLWPRHQHHAAAQAWFAEHGYAAWATNSITQLGVIRLLTNPVVTRGVVSPTAAVSTLAGATSHPNHQFWALDKPATTMLSRAPLKVTGHRQWPDLLLLRQAVDHGGRLVTFDSGLAATAGADAKAHLLILR